MSAEGVGRCTRRCLIWLVGLSLLAVTAVVVFTAPTNAPRDAAYVAGLALACTYAWMGARRAPESMRLFGLLVATGISVSSLGDVLYLAEDWLGGPQDIRWSDIPHFATYPLLGGALIVAMFPRSGRRRVDPDTVIDALTVVTVLVLVLWNLSAQLGRDLDLSLPARLVWGAYPIADAVVMALVLRALSIRRSRELVGRSFAVGIGCWVTADVVMNVYSRNDLVLGVLGPCWLLGTVLMARGTWHTPSGTRVEDAESDFPGRHLGRISIAILPLLVPPVLSIVNNARDAGYHSYTLFTGMVVLIGLAFWRTARMLSAQQASRAEVVQSRRFHARLAANSSDAVIVVDGNAGLLSGSERYRSLLGSEPPRSREAWLERLRLDDTSELARAFDAALRAPGVPHTVEVQTDPTSPGPSWLSARIVNLIGDPDVRGIVVSLSDITDRKEIEYQLAQARDAALEASRAKSAFLATMSHEIRTPMNGVIGLTRLLLTTEQDERQRTYAEGVRTAGEGLLTIINDILDFSKVEAGRLELETIDVDVLQIVEDAADTVAEGARAKGLELVAHAAPELASLGLRGDPSRLRQVLLNLVANAVKFTERGEVVVRAGVDDRDSERAVVRFEVADTGIGIPPEAQADLFDAFSQADSTTTRQYGGTGLGLAIVRQFVSAMGGEVGMTSEPGLGSTFWFTVPLERTGDDPAPVPSPLGGVRALVVDDNLSHRSILEEQLAAWGMRVDVVDSARTAVRSIEQAADRGTPYELAVIDLGLPGMDGLALAGLLSTNPVDPAGPPLGIVLLTAGAEVSDREARDAGVGARVAKPVHLAELRKAVLGVLDAIPGDEQAPVSTPISAEARVHRGHLLVVEDSDINQMVAVGLLQGLGFTAEVAEDGVSALAALESGDFAAVLMDCQMPVMDGYEATRRLRAWEGDDARSSGHLPVIAMTASVTDGERERCTAAGMDDFVAKPVSPEELDAALRRWVPLSLPGSLPRDPGPRNPVAAGRSAR
ncbi:hybrid sensor histidine kinase/response regulator [Nocardioides pacificus]